MEDLNSFEIPKEKTKTLFDNMLFKIPGKVFTSDISPTSKLLYSIIFGLCSKSLCYATNDYFAKLLGVSVRQVQNCLSELKKNEFISIREDKNNRYIMAKVTFEIISPKKGKINNKDFDDFGGFEVL